MVTIAPTGPRRRGELMQLRPQRERPLHPQILCRATHRVSAGQRDSLPCTRTSRVSATAREGSRTGSFCSCSGLLVDCGLCGASMLGDAGTASDLDGGLAECLIGRPA